MRKKLLRDYSNSHTVRIASINLKLKVNKERKIGQYWKSQTYYLLVIRYVFVNVEYRG